MNYPNRPNWFRRTWWKIEAIYDVIISDRNSYYISKNTGVNKNRPSVYPYHYCDVAQRGYVLEVKVNGQILSFPCFTLSEVIKLENAFKTQFGSQWL